MFCKNLKILINFVIVFNVCCLKELVQGNYLEENFPKSVLEDANLDTTQLIRKYQYPLETHYVTTEDNYILQLHRIPKPNAPPIFLMHGLLDSSSTWILMGPDRAPGYFFSDSGYDVWMGNARGNRYSRNHTTLNPDKDREFWNFSWHQIGFIDLPTMIDYVLKETGFKKTGYFGHSQGTTSFWVLCSMRPEYNDKITMMHAIAPVAFCKNIVSLFFRDLAEFFIAGFKQYIREFLPRKELLHKTCLISKTTENICVAVMDQILGRDDEQNNATMLPAILGHFPAGASFMQYIHYHQLVNSNRFCQYDYGPEENIKRYGKSLPPAYPLEKITVPVGLYYTRNDYLSSVSDVKRLIKILPNVVDDCLYPSKTWNHMTPLWGIDAREYAHKRMLRNMKNYSYF